MPPSNQHGPVLIEPFYIDIGLSCTVQDICTPAKERRNLVNIGKIRVSKTVGIIGFISTALLTALGVFLRKRPKRITGPIDPMA